MKKTNKKRNAGLMYEFLVKAMAQALIDKDDRRSNVALKIVKEAFAQGTELRKELNLMQQLSRVRASGVTAARLVSEVRTRACSCDANKLDREKSLLIRNVNHRLSDNMFYDRHVNEYRSLQSIQSLFNEWRAKEPDLSRLAELETTLVSLLESDRTIEEVDADTDAQTPGQRRLLMSVMSEKLNQKYGDKLNSLQREMIRGFVRAAASSADNLRETMNKLKTELLMSIESYATGEPKEAAPEHLSKLTEVKERLLAEDVENADESSLVRFMSYAKLLEELRSE